MESGKSALKRSFFREYFFHKLRGTLGIGITSAVLGFFTCTLSGILALSCLKTIERELSGGSGYYSTPDTSMLFTMMFGGLVGLAVLALVTPIIMFKYYRSRSSMDTIGCLPITYRERFWGDYLSGLAAIVVPFSAMAVIGGIPFAMMQPIVNDVKSIGNLLSGLDGADSGTLLFGMRMYFIMLIIIVAAYSITTLVVSCCGKVGSMGLYSVIALPIIPAVVGLYGLFTMNFTKGIIPEQQINTILSCFPPMGTFMHLMSDMNLVAIMNYYDSNFTLIPNAAAVIVPLLFIAALLAASYFIGKKRKTERVGNGFVVNAMYHILTLLMVLAVIGVYFSVNRIFELDSIKFLSCAFVALVFYMVLEVAQYRKIKAIWKSLIRYACVAVVGFGFLIAAMQTRGFGIGTHLPNPNDIEEITIESRDFGNPYGGRGTIKYRAESAISAILAENQRLIDNYDKISTGSTLAGDNEINFIYNLKNGDTVARYYLVNDEGLLGDVVEEIRKQPTYNIELLGVLNRDDLTGIKMTFTPFDDNRNPQNEKAMQIKESRIPELVERLKYDIINSGDDRGETGILSATVPSEWSEGMSEYDEFFSRRWFIENSYTRTVEFLNNPDNFYEKEPEGPVSPPEDKVKLYRVYYSSYTDENKPSPAVTSASVNFRSDSDSEYAKELMSYFVRGSEELSNVHFAADAIDAETEQYLDEPFYIPEENHAAALRAMMNLIAEQTEMLQ